MISRKAEKTESLWDCSLAISIVQCRLCACTSHHSTGCVVFHPDRLQPFYCSSWPLPHRDTGCVSLSPDLTTVPVYLGHGARGPTCSPQLCHFKWLLLKASQDASDTVNPPFFACYPLSSSIYPSLTVKHPLLMSSMTTRVPRTLPYSWEWMGCSSLEMPITQVRVTLTN